VDPGKLLAETEAVTRDIVTQSPLAVRLTWEVLHRGLNMTVEESTLLGADYFGLIASTDDFRIGTKAVIPFAMIPTITHSRELVNTSKPSNIHRVHKDGAIPL
jgi:hypothetical protein